MNSHQVIPPASEKRLTIKLLQRSKSYQIRSAYY